ncbi:hypothetical protein [Amycolatopsis benzoatilytica]|uniref:hypothetical protein n=1 Tax=Amycolatopsis benzoatilytica TaxID=346045 RepID=UPI000370D29C|nr:hypothetical protein [Amycolatopsis benzoatilytica]
MRKTRLAVVAAGLALALLTGCSSGGSGDSASQVASLSSPKASPQAGSGDGKANAASDQDAMRAYAKCMREHGVDMPDPVDGAPQSITLNAGDPGQNTALDACRKLLPNGGAPKKMTAEQLDAARKDAKCMRDHGIDMPDPDPDPNGQMQQRGIKIGPDEDKFETALKACGMGMATGK